MRPLRGVRGFWLIAALAVSAAALAHDARPLSINIIQQGPNLYAARIRVPPTLPVEDPVRVTWPAGCAVINDDTQDLGSYGWEIEAVRCRDSLEGQSIKVSYQVYNPALPTLFRLSELDGRVITRVLPPDQAVWSVPKSPGAWQVAGSYLKLGMWHIWTGIDHLLFVTGLLILAGTTRRVLLAITGFTIAHSITLALSALNLVVLAEPPVEAAIALSILFLAYEIARPFPQGFAARYPILVASSFGLLHGFGFAAALRDVGLPAKELAVGLFCFNCGVEIGQIAFITGVLAIAYMARWATDLNGARGLVARLAQRQRLISGYVLGVPAAFWFIQRLAAF